MNNRKKLDSQRVLIVGTGIGLRHLSNLIDLLPEATYRILTRKIQSFADYQSCQSLRSLSQAVDFDPTITVLANPSSHRLDVATALLATRSSFFFEKPLSNSAESGRKILSAVSSRQSLSMVGYNLRFTRSLRLFRQLVVDESYGRIQTVTADVGQDLKSWRSGRDYSETVSAQRKLGGGVLLELSHEIDYLTWIFGELVCISSLIRKVSTLNIDVEDYVSAQFLSTSDVPITLTMDFLRHGPIRQCTVVCENATIRWDGVHNSVALLGTNGTWRTLERWDNDVSDSYREEMKHFLECFSTDSAPECGIQEALNVLELLESMKEIGKKQ